MRAIKERPCRANTASEQKKDTDSTLSVDRRCHRRQVCRKRYPPSWQPYVVVDDFARNPNIDFPIACFCGGAS